ncbi:MAG: DNA gyrase subunit A [Candidatus Alcyoniella australis]|nr:DNA gyrase subunit A [Candidatus Alcyoniella australis]
MNERIENKVPINIEDEMRNSYLAYAMSVIVGRALPEVRDGLKPVHRRVLYSMHESGYHYNRAYRKSSKIVGEVMGNYHPHGDSAIYDTVVRLAQDFSMRCMLVDGQGNFGSIDGDPPAAMRYTEVRLARLAGEMLTDIDKETVDFVPNYDNTTQEPEVLPAPFPNLLVNGAEGIAVGMATKIPPHNLGEVIDATMALIDDSELTIKDLMGFIPGPDFPTGAFIHGLEGIRNAYHTGKGIVKLRARVITETNSRTNRESIVITELPYQVNKARLVERIAALIREKKIEGVSDLRDESDRDGIRVVVELKRDEISGVLVNQLYKHTPLESTFGVIMLALVDGRPQLLTLKQLLEHFINFRKEVTTRRCRYLMNKAEARAHILEGLKIALDHIDAVIKLIRASKTPPEAKQGLVDQFELSDLQAQAILDMRLQRLTGLERDKIDAEYAELIKEIERLRQILSNERLLMAEIKNELLAIRERYADERRTEILPDTGEISIEDMIIEEDMAVTISNTGYIKRNPVSLYRAQHRGGKGKIGMDIKSEDFVSQMFVASTHDYVLFFTDQGRVYWLKVHQIPQGGRATRGKAIVNLLQISKTGEKIATILPVKEFTDGCYVLMVTERGVVKKTNLMAFSNPRANGILAIKINEKDHLIAAKLTDGHQDVFLGTREGKSIRFKESDVRAMQRTAAGVRGMTLGKKDICVGAEILSPGASLITATEHGFGKRTSLDEYRLQGRGGQGIITIKTSERNGKVVGFLQVTDEDDVLLITDGGKIIRLDVSEIRVIGRNTQGVRLFDITDASKVVGICKHVEKNAL